MYRLALTHTPRLLPTSLLRQRFSLEGFLDKILHPEAETDPGKPFTPPPSLPSKEEQKDDDDDGPSFPMSPALA